MTPQDYENEQDVPSGSQGGDHSPDFLGENDSGLDRRSTPPHEKGRASEPLSLATPAVLHVIVDVADVSTLQEEGGPEVVQEVIREAIERDGLDSVLHRLRRSEA